ncbi:MAG: hypothetical protein NUV91_04590 [Candidatus Omnitrophica bacterium]|nr:hypothetical protein [Candidatus Omnitrophota bacterium]
MKKNILIFSILLGLMSLTVSSYALNLGNLGFAGMRVVIPEPPRLHDIYQGDMEVKGKYSIPRELEVEEQAGRVRILVTLVNTGARGWSFNGFRVQNGQFSVRMLEPTDLMAGDRIQAILHVQKIEENGLPGESHGRSPVSEMVVLPPQLIIRGVVNDPRRQDPRIPGGRGGNPIPVPR